MSDNDNITQDDISLIETLVIDNAKLRSTIAVYEEALKIYADEHAWGTCGVDAAGNVHEFAYDDEPFAPAKEALEWVKK